MSKKQNQKPKQTRSTDDLAKDIKKASELSGIAPWLITRPQYYKFGGQFSEWDFRAVGGFNSVKDAYFKPSDPVQFDVKTDLDQIKSAYRKLLKESGDLELLFKRAELAVSEVHPIETKPYKPSKNTTTERAVNVVWSDLHFGSDLSMEECNHEYGPVEEARAFAALIKNMCSYKLEYRNETEANVFILGDIIENKLHGSSSADEIHIQACRAIHLLAQGVSQLSSNFKHVNVYFAVGNHGRDIAVHHGRATAIKYNALETTIYFAVKTALMNAKNVSFFQPLTPWIDTKIMGHRVYATHGDTNLNPGNVGSKIDIKSIENQINKINAALKDHEEYKIFMCGHVHAPTFTQLSNGSFLVVNGALTPPNSYANSLNIHESPQVQIMWESTSTHPVGDIRFINCSGHENDSSLDSIIQPFKGLNHEATSKQKKRKQ